jgi:hypothetical protein
MLLLLAVETVLLPHTKQGSNSTLQPVVSRPSLGCSCCNSAQLSSVLSEGLQHAGCYCCFGTAAAAVVVTAADATAVAEAAASTAAKAGNCCSDRPGHQQRLLLQVTAMLTADQLLAN